MIMNLEGLDINSLRVQTKAQLQSPMTPGRGVTASDQVLHRELVRELIYKRADLISVGVDLVGLRAFDNLDVKYAFASDAAVEYPVAEGSGADLTRVTWAEFGLSLEKAEGRFFITDEAKIRGVGDLQWQTGIRRIGEALAAEKDTNILATMYAGTAQTRACTANWDVATAAQITGDISNVVNLLIASRGATDADLGNITFIVPIPAWTGLLRIFNIGGANVQLLSWIQGSYGITIRPTKNTLLGFGAITRGLAMLTGASTGVHGVLSPQPGVPLVETKRQEGIGTEYIVRQWFATTTIPDNAGSMLTNRICTLTNID